MLGCTARLAPPKDLITLLDALARPGCERWELRVFGDGPDRAHDRAPPRRARAWASASRCSATATTCPAQLAGCDAFALISDWEGLPYSILEAMAAGLPVLATTVGGIPDLVVPASTGELVPPRDAAAAGDVLAAWAADAGAAAGARRRRACPRAWPRSRASTWSARYDALFASLL